MKSTFSVFAIVIAISVFAASIGGATTDNAATEANTAHENVPAAQADNPTGRFQISSFVTPKSGSGVGYYVIDSTTGEIWMNYGENKPSKVSEPLVK